MSRKKPKDPWSYTLWLLTGRDYTRKQIRDRLARKGFEEEEIAGVLEKLAEYRLVDDAAYARAFVASRSRNKGSLALARELRQRGVTDELAERALQGLDTEKELASALDLLARNAWRFTETEDVRRGLARAHAFLARRGFPPDVAREALESSGLFDLEGD